MIDRKMNLEKEILTKNDEIMNWDYKISWLVLKIESLHQKLESVINEQPGIKYSFKNIISFGLFNFFKKKKIEKINQKIKSLMAQIGDFDDKKSQIKTKIIEKYKTIFNIISDKQITLQQENICFRNQIKELDKKIEKQDLEIKSLQQQFQLNIDKKIAIKYSFKNIISFGLFNFFKKKKINNEISILKGNIDHFNDKKSQLQTSIIEKYKNIIPFQIMKNMSASMDNLVETTKDNFDHTDNINYRPRSNSI